MDLAVLDYRQERSVYGLSVQSYLNALHRTAEAFGLADMDVG